MRKHVWNLQITFWRVFITYKYRPELFSLGIKKLDQERIDLLHKEFVEYRKKFKSMS